MLDTKTKRQLKAKAHHLKPVIRVGNNGVSEAVIAETEIALTTHELIKVKIAASDKHEIAQLAQQLAQQTKAEVVGQIGSIAILFRKN